VGRGTDPSGIERSATPLGSNPGNSVYRPLPRVE
jgi:hypothetical protein